MAEMIVRNEKNKTQNGITLIALVITIIVLLILAGVTIVTLTGDGGLLGKASVAALAHKKSEYFEEIKMEASQEHIERIEKSKEEAFITSLANRLSPEKKDWVSSIIKCDEEFEEKVDDYENNLLIITTKENYEIYVDVNNGTSVATIREGNFEKASGSSIVTYDRNTGTGTMDEQSIKTGFYMTLSENTFTRDGYVFDKWNTQSDNTGTNYTNNQLITTNSDMTLYAQWTYVIPNYTRYYADFDGVDGVDGIIYADLLAESGNTGTGLLSSYTIPSEVTLDNVKNYVIDGSYTDPYFGTHSIIKPEGGTTGKERFYVMELTDSGSGTWSGGSGINFGTGKSNCGGSTWFIPSNGEWEKFFNLLRSESGATRDKFGLARNYWTSSQKDSRTGWYVMLENNELRYDYLNYRGNNKGNSYTLRMSAIF